MAAFEQKMAKWTLNGKRIADGGSSWVVPDMHYIGKLKASSAGLCNARTAMPSI